MKHLIFFLLLCLSGSVHAFSFSSDNDSAANSSQGGAAPVQPVSANALYEMMRRMEQLQTEVKRLTGRVEEQAHLISEMKKSQSTLYSDFDERIQALENKAGATAGSPVSEAQPQESADMPEPVSESGDAKADSSGTKPQVEAEQTQAPGEAGTKEPVAAGDEKQQYQQAYDAFRNGHNAQAINLFNEILNSNPNGAFANNARYWLGEAYRVNQEVDLARQAFNSVIENTGNSKVPDAMLKLAILETEQKNIVKAKELLNRVTSEFPKSTAARLAAKKLLLLDDVKQ